MREKDRVAILTLSASDNCGSLLQTYALQRFLQEQGYLDVEIIDFESAQSKKVYNIFSTGIILQPRKLFFTLVNYCKLKKQKNDYNLFRKNELRLSKKKYMNVKELRTIRDKYDVVICGSDQIWNVCMYDFSEAFFLADIDNVKKIAYAASLGGHRLCEYHDSIALKKWLADFEFISVRERPGKEEVEEYSGKDVEVLADPTLLIEEKSWKDIMPNDRIIKEKYIFYYSWSYKDLELIEMVKEVAKELNKAVYVINASKWLMNSYNKYGFKLCHEGGPYAFLNLIYYADYVFVESLHGIIFSSIFKKNFWFLNGVKEDNIDQRINYFLSTLNLKDRVIQKGEKIDLVKITKNEEYKTNVNLDELVSKSRKWIKKAIEQN